MRERLDTHPHRGPRARLRPVVALVAAWMFLYAASSSPADDSPTGTPPDTEPASGPTVDFNREIRPILSNNCFACHGPDAAERQADLRLDTPEGALADLGGYQSVVPGKPDESELVARVEADDDLRMPPSDHGPRLKPSEIQLLRRWIAQGGNYDRHWSYTPPVRPELPAVQQDAWPRNPIDRFVLARLEAAGLQPSPEADRHTLIRRLSLDLTGLPPTLAQVETFVNDASPNAYERLVDRLLSSQAYGERWAAMWLDLARYADSAGYANDPPRTIWLYRDWVIRAFNRNLPFDQFTIDQLAGDLLPNPTQDQLIATAFHRNTLTNSEGGTSDEEFRNVAIVDRVNTTLQVWMGTTINCAQCHNHKYDPISQKDYFQLFAILNNTQDADRADESPVLPVWTEPLRQQKEKLEAELSALRSQLRPDDAQLQAELAAWENTFQPANWTALTEWHSLNDSPKQQAEQGGDAGTVTVRSTLPEIHAVQIELRSDARPEDSRPAETFSVTRLDPQSDAVGVTLRAGRDHSAAPRGRFVRVDLPGRGKMVHLAEVQVFSDGRNVALDGTATQSSTDFGGPAARAIDGNTDGAFSSGSVTHTAIEENPWWQVDLGTVHPIDRIVVWNRTDNGLQSRLDGFRLSILDAEQRGVWSQEFAKAPQRERSVSTDGLTLLKPSTVTEWRAAVDGVHRRTLVLQLAEPLRHAEAAQLVVDVRAEADAQDDSGGWTALRLSATADAQSPALAVPPAVQTALALNPRDRTEAHQQALLQFYRAIREPSPKLLEQIAATEKRLAQLKPVTVPVMRELPADQQRETFIQIRGNFLETGERVESAVPDVWHDLPENAEPDRLGLARWLVSPQNPLTPRVLANRYWEQLFGAGLVRTSEEFGAQGELPSHPLLLDWLATELLRKNWDLKAFLKTIVMSATYRQSSRETPELLAADPFNRLLSRGPRFRLSAEMIRDQALAVSGLLSYEMFGPSVQPPRPKLGLRAAFGGSTDWETSPGEDRYRRGVYTSWRRSLPYPSMATFDAPNRNVCTIRRIRTNTPLQALVTLNDPVYIEAAQGLARRILREAEPQTRARVEYGFRLCLARPPEPAETRRLEQLVQQAQSRFAENPEAARAMATDPLGPPPAEMELATLAAWTVVSNVLLNLDETLAKR